MSACTICGRESSTRSGHLSERSNEIARLREERDAALRVASRSADNFNNRSRDASALVTETVVLRKERDAAIVERDQARAEAMALRDALVLFRDIDLATTPHFEGIQGAAQKALATPSGEHLRAVIEKAYIEGCLDGVKNSHYPCDSNHLWQQSAIRASLGKEGA